MRGVSHSLNVGYPIICTYVRFAGVGYPITCMWRIGCVFVDYPIAVRGVSYQSTGRGAYSPNG